MKSLNPIHPTLRLFGEFRFLFIFLLLLLTLQSCLGPLPSSRPVCGNCEAPNRFVRLEKFNSDFPPDAHPPFSHPFQLNSDEWTQILSTIYVQKLKPGLLISGGHGEKESAFTEEEIRFFSMSLPKAFEAAQSDEVVVYALSRSPLPHMSEISTGGLYVKGDALHVVLSNQRQAVSMPSIRELLWEHPLHSQTTLYEFVQGNYQTIQKQDLLGIAPTPLEMTIAFKDLLLALTGPSKPDSEHSPTISPTPQKAPGLSVEDSLEMLKHLRERNLITEEDFQTKKQELLDRL